DQRTAHERLLRMCFIDYDRQIALVAERRSPETGAAGILAVGRLVKLPGGAEAECAFIVTDRFQRLGLGTELVRRLIEIARAEGVARLKAEILSENTGMQRIFRKLGFGLKQIEATVVSATLEL